MTEERGSDKHGPRVDEELEQELRPMEQGGPADARAEEGRQQEAPGDFEPTPDSRVGHRGASPLLEISDDPAEARREVARALDPSIFPADRTAVLRSATDNHARAPVIQALEALPLEGTYKNVEELWLALVESAS